MVKLKNEDSISQQRGFVLHCSQQAWSRSLALSKELMLITSKESLLTLGTEKAPVDANIHFNTPIERRWIKACEKLGIDLAHLSSDIGHA
mgnify:CR=1 FL=1|tara:strand:- start:123 stop:392 length:270 start_codon:yes stop_codon:yes gene_type:complete